MKDASKPKGARLFLILAREARVGVIFRRGPSRWVQLIRWDTNKDTFEYGQWFNGRIYERRCDLSPKGDKLIYFAAKFKKTKYTSHYSWTAISNPPWFKALLLWPKGDCWHGGGSFKDAKTVLLNHRPHQAIIDPNFALRHVTVQPNPIAQGEDEPIYSERLERDGWKLVQMGKYEYYGLPGGWVADPPEIWEKIESRKRFVLRMIQSGIHSIQGDEWHILEFEVRDQKTGDVMPLGRASWADWDHRTHLVYAKAGKLFRHDLRVKGGVAKEIADFNSQKPRTIPAPAKASTWKS